MIGLNSGPVSDSNASGEVTVGEGSGRAGADQRNERARRHLADCRLERPVHGQPRHRGDGLLKKITDVVDLIRCTS